MGLSSIERILAQIGFYVKYIVADQSRQVTSDYETIRREYSALQAVLQNERQEYDALCLTFKDFQKNAIGNMLGLRSAMIAWVLVTTYMLRPGSSKDLLEDARRYLDDIINQIKPDDDLVSSLALGVQGTILYFDDNFKAATDALRKSVGKNNENFSSHFNLACCACKLADEIEAKGDAEITEIVALENEALSSLLRAVTGQPWRKTKDRIEGETGDMKRLYEHPQFKLIISA